MALWLLCPCGFCQEGFCVLVARCIHMACGVGALLFPGLNNQGSGSDTHTGHVHSSSQFRHDFFLFVECEFRNDCKFDC